METTRTTGHGEATTPPRKCRVIRRRMSSGSSKTILINTTTIIRPRIPAFLSSLGDSTSPTGLALFMTLQDERNKGKKKKIDGQISQRLTDPLKATRRRRYRWSLRRYFRLVTSSPNSPPLSLFPFFVLLFSFTKFSPVCLT